MDMKFAGIVWTGSGLLDVQNPDPRAIHLADIARGLSRRFRFNGHTRDDLPAYGVTWHSLFCEAVADQMGLPLAVRFQALLHDAPEYIMGDLVTPLKVLVADAWGPIETAIWNATAASVGIPAEFHPAVREIDHLALEVERVHLMPAGAWEPAPHVPAEWAEMGRKWVEFALAQGDHVGRALFLAKARTLAAALRDGGR